MTVDSASVSWNLHDFRLSVLQADAKKENGATKRMKRETVTAQGSGSRRPRRNTRYSWQTMYYVGDFSQWNFFSVILFFVWIISVPSCTSITVPDSFHCNFYIEIFISTLNSSGTTIVKLEANKTKISWN